VVAKAAGAVGVMEVMRVAVRAAVRAAAGGMVTRLECRTHCIASQPGTV